MRISERQIKINDVELSYVFQPAKQDRRHLVVIFSGFGSHSSVTYDFTGESANSCRSSILWIKDEFNKECSYYLNTVHSDGVETAVYGLISLHLEQLGIDKDKCILVGFSKGGTAALYYGIKFGFKNILSSCPQFHIETYVKNNWPNVYKNIVSHEGNGTLNNILPDLIKNDCVNDRNIYLISSPNDLQYKSEIEPYLSHFYKYDNFNFVFTKSQLAWQHNKVTRYNLPLILSILYAHGEGARPKFGWVVNDGENISDELAQQWLEVLREKQEVISDIQSCWIENELFHIKGFSFIKGFECPDYSSIKHSLIFSGGKHNYTFPLGKVLNKEVNYKYFDRVLCDYSAAEFTTIGHKGIDISHIERDVYTLQIKVECNGIVKVKNLETSTSFHTTQLINSDEYYLGTFEGSVCIHKKSLLEEDSDRIFKVSSKWHKGNLLHYEGVFAIKGVNVSNWGDASYYIVLKGATGVFPFRIGMSELNNSGKLFKDAHDIYKKSYFSTLGGKGINISKIPKDNYDVFICMSHQGKTFLQKTSDLLSWDGNDIALTLDVSELNKLSQEISVN